MILKLECADIRSTLGLFKPQMEDLLDHWVWGHLLLLLLLLLLLSHFSRVRLCATQARILEWVAISFFNA